jgi:signal peptidase II
MKRVHYLLLALVVLVLDAWTKWLVSGHIALHESIPLVPDFIQLVHVRNTGAAFGIGANSDSRLVPLLLNAGAIGVFCIVVIYAIRTAVSDRLLQTGLHLILGVYVRDHHWPAFNVADSAICIGIALLFLDMRKTPQETPVAEPESAVS